MPTASLAAHDTPIVAPGLLRTGGLGLLTANGLLAGNLLEGTGLAGQYIHDFRGSGLDGQYVHDFTETLYDNGQYHGEIYA